MANWAVREIKGALTGALQHLERRPYRRIAITGPGRVDEPRARIEAAPLSAGLAHGGLADGGLAGDGLAGGLGAGGLATGEVVVSLTIASDHATVALQSLLEVITVLHDGDIAAVDGLVIIDCLFQRAWTECNSATGLSSCSAAFLVTALED